MENQKKPEVKDEDVLHYIALELEKLKDDLSNEKEEEMREIRERTGLTHEDLVERGKEKMQP